MTESTDTPRLGQPQHNPYRWEAEQPAKFLSQRTASEDARFVLGFIKPGMSLLDCGCGPGSITLGLAPYVAPGKIRGIDINSALIEQAKAAATEQGVTNVHFQVGDALDLPFGNNTFDVVFSHALIEHLPKPEQALAQMKRVLKPGGIIAVRTPEWTGNTLYPDENDLHRRLTTFMEQVAGHAGSNPYCGRQLGAWLYALGFSDIRLTASYTCYGTPERVAAFAQVWSENLLGPERVNLALSKEWATRDAIDQIKADFSAWAQMPGAFHMRAWMEAVARKP